MRTFGVYLPSAGVIKTVEILGSDNEEMNAACAWCEARDRSGVRAASIVDWDGRLVGAGTWEVNGEDYVFDLSEPLTLARWDDILRTLKEG